MKDLEKKTPALGWKILQLLWPDTEAESISGDYEVVYQDLLGTKGPLRARLWYWFQIIRSAMTALSVKMYWTAALLRSNLRFTARTVKRNKGYSMIIVSSLAVGLAVCVMILQWVQYERSYDTFHPDLDRLFRLTVRNETRPPDQGTYAVPGPVSEFLKSEYPEVEDAARFCPIDEVLLGSTDKKFFARCGFVDPSFLTLFSFPLKRGDVETVLAQPLSVVLTDTLARKFFDREDPTGQTINISYQGRTGSVQVTGVVKDPPDNSHLRFDALLPFVLAPSGAKRWENQWPSAYIRLSENISAPEFDTKISGVLKAHNPEWHSLLGIQALKKSHIGSVEGQKLSRTIDLFSILGLFILVMACVNFINLTTARGTTRLKEIGVKKILGSSRRQLIGQILTESLSFAFAALILAVLLVRILSPFAAVFLGKTLDDGLTLNMVFILLGMAAASGLLSGIVPSLIFSSFRLQDVLKGGFVSGKGFLGHAARGLSPGLLLRRGLAVFQLVLMISFLVSVIVIQRQMDFVRNRDLGMTKDHVISLGIPVEITLRYDAFKAELMTNPDILGVTGISSPVNFRSNFQLTEWEGEQHPRVDCGLSWVDQDFARTLDIEVLEGRFFSKELADDRFQSFVANEALVRAMGIGDPVGTKIRYNKTLGTIIGVVKDFHIESLHREIRPHILIFPTERSLRYFYIRIKPGEIPATLGFIRDKINTFSPNYPFDYRFLSEEVEGFYKNERLVHRLTGIVTFIAVVISSLGLFGLIAYTAERRTKEIGIRKVLGASLGNVFTLLTREFVLMVTAANVLAWPMAFLVLRGWLDNFAYRAALGVVPFLLSGAAALCITMLTIGYQALKGASADPVASLRYE